MTVKVVGNTIHVFTATDDWRNAADIASYSRPFKRHFYAAADPASINPEYKALLKDAEDITYDCTPLTLDEAKKLDMGIVTSDDEFEFEASPEKTAFYQHSWTFSSGFPH